MRRHTSCAVRSTNTRVWCVKEMISKWVNIQQDNTGMKRLLLPAIQDRWHVVSFPSTWMSKHVFQSRSVRSDHRICLCSLYVSRLHDYRSEQSIDLATLRDQLVGQEWRSVGVLGTAFKWPIEYKRSLGELGIAINWQAGMAIN